LRDVNKCPLEGLNRLPVTFTQCGKYHRGKVKAQCAWIKLCSIAEQYT